MPPRCSHKLCCLCGLTTQTVSCGDVATWEAGERFFSSTGIMPDVVNSVQVGASYFFLKITMPEGNEQKGLRLLL